MSEPINPIRRMISLALVLSGGFFIWWIGPQAEQSSSQDQQTARPMSIMEGWTMGTRYQVTLADVIADEDQHRLTDQFEAFLKGFNHIFSTYDSESEISRFNESASTDWFPVSSEFIELMRKSNQITEDTNGYFDPTVGPLINIWNFGPDIKDLAIPTDQEIQETKEYVGSQLISIRETPPALKKLDHRVQIDFSAMAKGAAVDQIASILDEAGYQAYLINIGGEIIAKGLKTNGLPWKLGIEKPVRDQRLPFGEIEITDIAMATSGDYRNYYRYEGHVYSHTIDPHTGRPTEHGLRSVTVIDQNCGRADAYATALMAMGPELAVKFMNQSDLRVCLLTEIEERIVPHYSPEWVMNYGEPWK